MLNYTFFRIRFIKKTNNFFFTRITELVDVRKLNIWPTFREGLQFKFRQRKIGLALLS